MNVTPEEVICVIKSFPNGSSGSFDGLSAQHLKDLTNRNNEKAKDLVNSLVPVMDLRIRGEVLEAVCPFLYEAKLVPLSKKYGGVCPIAVGNSFRRLCAKILGNRILDQLGAKFRPVQLD